MLGGYCVSHHVWMSLLMWGSWFRDGLLAAGVEMLVYFFTAFLTRTFMYLFFWLAKIINLCMMCVLVAIAL